MRVDGDIRILTTRQTEEWRQLVKGATEKDIHFEPEYLKVFEESCNEEARLFIYEDAKTYVAYPFFVRRVDVLPFFKQSNKVKGGMSDIVSPWYFGGPIARFTDDSIEEEVYRQFLDRFHTYCVDNGIVAEFTRLHPLFRGHLVYRRLTPETRSDRCVVYIDLQQDGELIWHNLSKSNRNAITKGRRLGVEVKILQANEGLSEFQQLYDATMRRKDARDEYLFRPSFFERMATLMPDSVTIVSARFEGRTIASSMFLHKYGFVHYYLSGSDAKFLSLCPNNVLLYEAILWAKNLGYKYFVLGGGYQPHDNLFRFKRSFSDTLADFCVYKKVHDEEAYERLCQLRDSYDSSMKISTAKTEYFPEYRKP